MKRARKTKLRPTSEPFIDINRYGFDHKAVSKKFGPSTYVGTFDFGGYKPWAVYRAAKPNLKKGHKKYFMLITDGKAVVITGRSPQRLAKYRYRDGIQCGSCKEIIFSSYRHDCRTCSCGNVTIDGGCDYTRTGARVSVSKLVTVDLLWGKKVFR